MRAWQVAELGEPKEAMRLVDVDEPQPGVGQLVVKVLASPANFPDDLMCRGISRVKPDLPLTPGVELCGAVVALGDGVPGFAVGERCWAARSIVGLHWGLYHRFDPPAIAERHRDLTRLADGATVGRVVHDAGVGA